jgi:RNA polymerase sigma factor (sigma-70 family)
MASGQLGACLRRIRRLIGSQTTSGHGDGQLLDRFVHAQDQAAFTALVERHGPMVLSVCRRVLHDEHDAEDVFQATFLVLVRKARTLNQYGSLGNWLHSVAHRLALHTRGEIARRCTRERQVADVPEGSAADRPWQELSGELDAELERLSVKYRAPVVLCYLEGKTNAEAAEELGWPVGTVKIRLARARELLRGRLSRRGLTLSAGLLAPALTERASAGVPAALLEATVTTATAFAAGNAAELSLRAAQIAQGALEAMFRSKVKKFVVLFLALGLVGIGSGVLLSQEVTFWSSSVGPENPAQAATASADPAAEKDDPVLAAPEPEEVQAQKRSDELSQRRLQAINNLVNQGRFEEAYKVALIMEADTIARASVVPPALLALLKKRAAADPAAARLPKREPKKGALDAERIDEINDLMNNGRFAEAYREAQALQVDQIARRLVLSPAMFGLLKDLAAEEPRSAPRITRMIVDKRPLADVLEEIALNDGITIVIDARVADKAAALITVKLQFIAPETALRLLVNMGDLHMVRVDDVLYVTSKENARSLQEQPPAEGKR